MLTRGLSGSQGFLTSRSTSLRCLKDLILTRACVLGDNLKVKQMHPVPFSPQIRPHSGRGRPGSLGREDFSRKSFYLQNHKTGTFKDGLTSEAGANWAVKKYVEGDSW